MVKFNRRNKRLQLTKLRNAIREVELDLFNYTGPVVDAVDRLIIRDYLRAAQNKLELAKARLR